MSKEHFPIIKCSNQSPSHNAYLLLSPRHSTFLSSNSMKLRICNSRIQRLQEFEVVCRHSSIFAFHTSSNFQYICSVNEKHPTILTLQPIVLFPLLLVAIMLKLLSVSMCESYLSSICIGFLHPIALVSPSQLNQLINCSFKISSFFCRFIRFSSVEIAFVLGNHCPYG